MEVKPFKAFRYDETVVGNVGDCTAPPYDVISPAQQEELHRKSEYNIVRITKGETTPSDNDHNNPYTRAADYLSTWMEKGALRQDSAEAIYGYVQDFQLAGKYVQRLSFVALARLEEFGKIVRPHEQIMNEPMIDRLNLKRATAARFGLVFMLYEDEHGVADKIIEKAAGQGPLIDFVDGQNVRHRLFGITDQQDIHAIAAMMHDKTCIIADGHHRYTTGLTYSKEHPSQAARYQMLAFVNTRHEGLVILATHRLVSNLLTFNFQELLSALKDNFELTEHRFDSPHSKTDARQQMLTEMKDARDHDKNAFGIYGGNSAFYVAVLNNAKAMDSAAPEKSPPWRSLDVSVLHKLILEELLGVGEKELAAASNVEYVKDNSHVVDELVDKIDAGDKQVVFFMNPTKIEQIQMVADHGERMPQKSTYFYPKVYTGLTIDKL
ncbi:MAG: DUF1015 domain-containing protein [Planctomycetota bacterium]|jgi:uncharacterized protein (DUF1015 family)